MQVEKAFVIVIKLPAVALAFACITTLSCIPKQPAPAPSPARELPGDARLPTRAELFAEPDTDEDGELEQLATAKRQQRQRARESRERQRAERRRVSAEEQAQAREQEDSHALCASAANSWIQIARRGVIVRLDANGTGPFVFVREKELSAAAQSMVEPRISYQEALDILSGLMFAHAYCIYPEGTYFRIVNAQGAVLHERTRGDAEELELLTHSRRLQAQEDARVEQERMAHQAKEDEVARLREAERNRPKPIAPSQCKMAREMWGLMANQGTIINIEQTTRGPVVNVREEQLYRAWKNMGPGGLKTIANAMAMHVFCIQPNATFVRIITDTGSAVGSRSR